ncbi:hypothetical protein LXL04_035429 [Taraxacum kok-saghyz]
MLLDFTPLSSLSFASTLFAYCPLSLSLSPSENVYCMAANHQSRGIASLGKRFVSQIRSSSARDPSLILRRAVHVSVYDKNIDDQVRPTLVPDEAITRKESEQYWAPHPKTGVFGPSVDEPNSGSGGASGAAGADGSVLEEKAFFRPSENLEKPAHA